LPGLTSNYDPPQPPKKLGLQAWATGTHLPDLVQDSQLNHMLLLSQPHPFYSYHISYLFILWMCCLVPLDALSYPASLGWNTAFLWRQPFPKLNWFLSNMRPFFLFIALCPVFCILFM
jgi:hypothetical protein